MMVFSEYFLIYLPMRYQLWRRWKSCILHYSGERLSIVEINIAVCSDENMCCSIVDSQPRRWTSSSCSQLLCVNHYQVSNTFWIFKDEFSLFPFFIIRVAAEKASKCDYNVKAGVVISALREWSDWSEMCEHIKWGFIHNRTSSPKAVYKGYERVLKQFILL